MDGTGMNGKEQTLVSRLMMRFILCMGVLLVLLIPILYYVTIQYYAEDLDDIIRTYGITNPDIDLEEDTAVGIFIQFMGIVVMLLIGIFIVMRFIPQQLWRPFNDTLQKLKNFRIESGVVPKFPTTGTKEFDELNSTLTTLMTNSVNSYKVQKEFTENASHELQTPIAIVQGKLDNLIQDSTLTESQSEAIQQIYQEIRHMSRLSRSLLLLSKIENNQYHNFTRVNVRDKVESLLPRLESIAGNIKVKTVFADDCPTLNCNEPLLESMLDNLVVNAVRHNKANGTILIKLNAERLVVANESDEPALDGTMIFSRFYRIKDTQKGNGLGLAIVKSICDFHKWKIVYKYSDKMHRFVVYF